MKPLGLVRWDILKAYQGQMGQEESQTWSFIEKTSLRKTLTLYSYRQYHPKTLWVKNFRENDDAYCVSLPGKETCGDAQVVYWAPVLPRFMKGAARKSVWSLGSRNAGLTHTQTPKKTAVRKVTSTWLLHASIIPRCRLKLSILCWSDQGEIAKVPQGGCWGFDYLWRIYHKFNTDIPSHFPYTNSSISSISSNSPNEVGLPLPPAAGHLRVKPALEQGVHQGSSRERDAQDTCMVRMVCLQYILRLH